MKPVTDILASRWSISFIGTALLAGLVWVFAPLLPQFEDWTIRLIIVLVLILVWGAANLLLDVRRRGRDAALAQGVTASIGAVEATEEAQALRDRMAKALDLLR
ncbi:MAG TPA: hypothetical protein VLI93_12020, partial [Acetobacteraceae bacterium]|nr:hypothetical protein [Acetobacteraceae bacterium]